MVCRNVQVAMGRAKYAVFEPVVVVPVPEDEESLVMESLEVAPHRPMPEACQIVVIEQDNGAFKVFPWFFGGSAVAAQKELCANGSDLPARGLHVKSVEIRSYKELADVFFLKVPAELFRSGALVACKVEKPLLLAVGD